MSSETLSHEEAISQFCGVTGADEDRAKGMLEACDWNLELAINMHVDTDDGRGNRPTNANSATSQTAAGSSGSAHAAPIVDLSESIIDEDNVEEITNHPSRLERLARRANAASGLGASAASSFCDFDDVRPPIPPVRQVLNPSGYSPDPQLGRRYSTRGATTSTVYDAFRDFRAEAQWQEMVQEGESSASEASSSEPKRTRTLNELFRPPLELMFRGSFVSAREAGSLQNKWLLVNIQNSGEFACQTLNRDVWSNQAVKDILKEHFIFWQVCHDTSEGARYIQFYNVSSFPHVAIIDPRTGEQMKSWPVSIDHNSFCDSVIEFLNEHTSPDGSTDANSMKKLRVKEEDAAARTLYDQSEEAQLEAAIKASLQETENSNSSKAFPDEDSYTDVIESDAELTQSSFHAQTSSSSSSTFNRQNDNRRTNGQQSSSDEFVGTVKKANSSKSKFERVTNIGFEESNHMKEDVKPEKQEVEDYKKYLGHDTEKFSDLIVRFPDGTRDQFKFPSDSSMKALFLLLTSRGYGMNQYSYVTNFPRRLLHELPSTDTLQDAKLFRETIFVERRTSDGK